MLTDSNIRRLTAINSIESLLEFLREDLKWEIDDPDPDVAANEFTPEELGLKEEHIPKINAIYQIRPVTSQQPWGIFFIDFENKKLPITIMRRILNQLVIKKRGTSSVGKGWDTGDLLFMTTYGESGSDPDVAFAHFHTQEGDLPTLRVMEWHKEDNPAKLKSTYEALKTGLGWPPDTDNQAAWREQWKSPFRHKVGHTIKTAKALAEKLAELSKNIKEACQVQLDAETEKGQITKLYHAFKEALVHDLKPEDFADTFAQTITYGLFSAAVSRRAPEDKGSKSLTTETMAQLVPETSPFLKEVLETFLDVGGRKGGVDFDLLGVQDVVELLRSDETDMQAILADFGSKRENHDPVIHFYEDYLAAFNKKKKVERGVFYTPQPVVSYIVRSVHELLQTEFGLEDGLASTTTWGEMAEKNPNIEIPENTDPDDPFVVILDPATGTATFLVEVIDVIWNHLRQKWKTDPDTCVRMLRQQPGNFKTIDSFESFWNAYVPDHLLTRLFGYELMMAPYAIAHMKVGLKLGETGYNFASSQRVWICLTNALEPPTEVQARLTLDWEALAHEATAVNAVKEGKQFTIIIGNPPYAQYSMNMDDASKQHIQKFRFANGRRIRARNMLQLERNLNDDYVKFIGFSTALLPKDAGLIGMVTNRMYLESESLVGLREWVNRHFDKLWFLDLWGSSEESRRIERLQQDESVFDILQGVAICLLVKHNAESVSHHVSSQELIGSRNEKYLRLQNELCFADTGWLTITPSPDQWILHRNSDVQENDIISYTLPQIFPSYSTLVASNRDPLVVSFDKEEVITTVEAIRSYQGSNEAWANHFGITMKAGWNINSARSRLATFQDVRPLVTTIEYRPYDRRWIFFDSSLVWQTAPVVSKNIIDRPSNLILISLGKNRSETLGGQWVTETIADKSVVSTRDNASGFPLYVFKDGGDLGFDCDIALPNIDPSFVRHLGEVLKLSPSSPNVLPEEITPENILHYVYSVLHSLRYRTHFSTSIKEGFPPIPLAQAYQLFDSLATLGNQLVSTHLMKNPAIWTPTCDFFGANKQIGSVTWTPENLGTIWINSSGPMKKPQPEDSGFRPVSRDIWDFKIGGYQVCEKWLKDRGPKKGKPGRILTQEDIEHYQKIVAAISETIRIMKEIDEVIEQHGGWPGAFQTGNEPSPTTE